MNFFVTVFSAACLLSLLCARCQAEDRVSIIINQIDDGQEIRLFRFNLAALAVELEKNETVSPCTGYVRICLKTEKCSKYLQRETDAGQTMCSILEYSPTILDAVLETKDSPKGFPLLQNSKNDGEAFDATTEIPLSPEHPSTAHPSPAEVWGFGVLAVGIISLSGLFGAVFWPLMKTTFYAQLMWVLIGLAVGSLTASATFQLIPEGFKLKEHDENYLNTALFMWVSFWALYMFEALSKIFLHSEPEVRSSMVVHTPQAQNCVANVTERPQEQLEINSLLPPMATKNGNTNDKSNLAETKSIPLYMSQGSLHNLTFQKTSHLHSHGTDDKSSDKKMATVAWMIIIGDGIHNFIDGMSIGAGFSNSIAVGTSISIAIACEEFPHELGDFAILINSGMSVKRALLFNFLSACTAFAGLVLGILLGEIDASIYIFAFAGGLFLYIALTDLMPELNEMIAAGLKKSKKYALFVLLLQNFGIFLGASILYAVTVLPINIS